jgi:hypothetical protein
MDAQGPQVATKKNLVIRNLPVGLRGRTMVWNASSATPRQQMIPAINAGRYKVKAPGAALADGLFLKPYQS